MSKPGSKLRIVAADDSAVMRHMLTMLFAGMARQAAAGTPEMELVATAGDGVRCIEAVRALQPDLVLLDVDMPHMGGMEVLDVLHRERPEMPVIMCSASTARGAASTLEALARGAADYVTKPGGGRDPLAAMASLSLQLLPKIVALTAAAGGPSQPLRTPLRRYAGRQHGPVDVVGIGVSTGGPAALEQLLPALPQSFPVPVVVVQHMPRLFTGVLAQRLDRVCRLRVREALDGAALAAGTVWLAPGDRHLEVAQTPGGGWRLRLSGAPPEHHCRPAVDVLFRSLARVCGRTALGVVLTGMGADGLLGARELVGAGAAVLAQDEATAAVWGMPGRVVEEGLASAVLPLHAIAAELEARTRRRVPAKPSQETFRYAMQ